MYCILYFDTISNTEQSRLILDYFY